jgi:prepilin-type N-terminal cleavage/methylation domain-containing protein
MKKSAFSLVELSVVIAIVGLLIAGVAQASKMVRESAVVAAQSQTKQSVVKDMPGLALWYESSLDSSFIPEEMVDSVEVSTWYDSNVQALEKTNASQVTANNKPLYIESAINGLPALKFSGSNYLAINNNFCTQTFTAFVVFKTSTVAGSDWYGGPILWADASGTTNDIVPFMINGSIVSIVNYNIWLKATSKVVTDGFPHVATISRHMVSGARNIWVDGANNVNDINGSAGVNLNGNMNLLIGGNTLDTRYYTGFIGEIIIFDRHLLTDERKAVEKYLGKKWKIDF